jgi:hypothetical protein
MVRLLTLCFCNESSILIHPGKLLYFRSDGQDSSLACGVIDVPLCTSVLLWPDVATAVAWPQGAEGHGLGLQGPGRTYYLYFADTSSYREWATALQRMVDPACAGPEVDSLSDSEDDDMVFVDHKV